VAAALEGERARQSDGEVGGESRTNSGVISNSLGEISKASSISHIGESKVGKDTTGRSNGGSSGNEQIGVEGSEAGTKEGEGREGRRGGLEGVAVQSKEEWDKASASAKEVIGVTNSQIGNQDGCIEPLVLWMNEEYSMDELRAELPKYADLVRRRGGARSSIKPG